MPNIKTVLENSKLERIDSELLLSYLLKKDRTFLIVNNNKKINNKDYQRFLYLQKKRLDNWPIAYLTGYKYFYNYKFLVNKNVLVPRPETEVLIDIIKNNILNKSNKFTFIDIGTGSGVIIITLAKEIIRNNKLLYKNSNFFSLDISIKALSVAKLNAKKLRIFKKIEFYKSDLLNIFKSKPKLLLNKNNLVIPANLPYLKKSELKEKSIKHEPKTALEAGEDGLKYYRQLFKQIKQLINDNNNQKIDIFCEINPGQRDKILELNKKYLTNFHTVFFKDLSKKTRFSQTKNY